MVGGAGDSVYILLQFPGGSVGTYQLADTWPGSASCTVYTPSENGWVVFSTDRSHSGFAKVTHVDSLSIAGTFYFDATDGEIPPHIHRITNGAFNVRVEAGPSAANLLSIQSSAMSRPSGRPVNR